MSPSTLSAPDETLAYTRSFVEATCAIVAAADRGPDAAVEALIEQAGRLTAAEVVVLLAAPGADQLVEIDPGRPPRPGGAWPPAPRRSQDPPPWRAAAVVDPLVRAAVARLEPALAPDPPAALAAPLVAGGELLGVLLARWTDQPAPSALELESVAALARHGGLAVRAARRRAAAASRPAQWEAVYSALSDAVLVFDRDGRLIDANRAGRALVRAAGGDAAVTARGLGLADRPRGSDRTGSPISPVARALAGESAAEERLWKPPGRPERRLHVVATPVRDEQGEVRAAAVIARDITELHRAVSARARFDGAVKTARRISHELGNQLAPALGYAEILHDALQGEQAEFANRIMAAVLESADTLTRLQRIIRFEQTEWGGELMLDLDAATTRQPDSP